MAPISRDVLHSLPKTDLHVHLDGSLRPDTVRELAHADGVEAPESIVIREPGSLVDYLRVFDFTLALLQTPEAIERVAFELAEDAAAENHRLIEVRYAPILHQQRGLGLDEIVDAVRRGLARAERATGILTGIIICGIRHIEPERSLELAELAVRHATAGVVGFDLAGAERDNPAKRHLAAFYHVLNANLSCTVHAGEAFGPASIHQALHYCGAHRIGHGTRLREDPALLEYVNDHRIPVEMCLTSNWHTGAVERLADHPFRDYAARGLRVCLNTDNRLISDTTMTDELALAVGLFDLGPDEIRTVLLNGAASAFLPRDRKVDLMESMAAEIDRLLELSPAPVHLW